ncbi:MAG: GNAT family N-acetyltransferase [Ktedonobacterales bacterium]|nr:GNAT family N-acetyltransferase [Ktedonobacterales bacterium]
MSDEFPYLIEPLDKTRHNRAAFACGERSLDNYLHANARKDVQAKVAVCYVARPIAEASVIAGYYTLTSSAVQMADVAPAIAKSAGSYSVIPSILIGRLAVDAKFQGQSIGRVLLIDALRRVWDVHQQVGVKLVVVDALHEQAARFYLKYGFVAFEDQPLQLYLPVATIGGLYL